ncbi:MAG: molybdate ABC transporter substrate-binding protein [Cyanobacteria bacterium P01_H01_bin.15]
MATLVTVSCGSHLGVQKGEKTSTRSVTLIVSAAASLQDVLEIIAPQFHATYPDVNLDFNFGSSGSLQRQIEQGAPADVFFSAATTQMDALAQQGLIVPDSRQEIVENRLVLIAPNNTSNKIMHVAQLRDMTLNRFAVGEFRSVPAGQYAEQVFISLNLLGTLQPSLVFGRNVRGVLTAVANGNAELGMVYATDAALCDRVKVLAAAPEEAHQPITYPIATLDRSKTPDAAQFFINFLQTEPARETFETFGFVPILPAS